MYFFKKQDEKENVDENQGDDIFNLRFKRKIFTKKEREKKLQDQRAQYSERFRGQHMGLGLKKQIKTLRMKTQITLEMILNRM